MCTVLGNDSFHINKGMYYKAKTAAGFSEVKWNKQSLYFREYRVWRLFFCTMENIFCCCFLFMIIISLFLLMLLLTFLISSACSQTTHTSVEWTYRNQRKGSCFILLCGKLDVVHLMTFSKLLTQRPKYL